MKLLTLIKEGSPTVEVNKVGEYGEMYSYSVGGAPLIAVDAHTPQALLMSYFTQALVMDGYIPEEKEFYIQV